VLGFVGELNELEGGAGEAAAALAALDDFDAVLAVTDREVRAGLLDGDRLDAVLAGAPDADALLATAELTGDGHPRRGALEAVAERARMQGGRIR